MADTKAPALASPLRRVADVFRRKPAPADPNLRAGSLGPVNAAAVVTTNLWFHANDRRNIC